MKINYKKWIIGIVIAAIILRIFLLFFAPVSMFADGVIRYLPDAKKVVAGDFSFNDVPLLIFIESFWLLFLKGKLLLLAWKLPSFLFFLGFLLLLPPLFKRFNLNSEQKLLMLALLLFSSWSLLLSVTVLQDMGIAFFALALFLSIENYFDKPGKKSILFLIVSCSLMILSKISGIIILGGFGLYVLLKREKDISKRIKCIFYLSIGALITAPWFIKNYILTGKIYLPNFTPPLISLHPFSAYVDYAVKTFHYFWEIPLPSKVNLGNIASSLYFCYYAAALIITLALSCLIIFAIVKYCKKYWQYLLITAPLASFCFYWAFLIFWGPHDVGRYSFPLWIFLFLFPVKLIGDMPSKKIKYLCYALIVAFCIISVVSACGITLHINSIDSQVVKIAETLKKQSIYDVETKLISNDEFTTCALSFYIERRVIFNMPQNVRDTNVSCTGEQIFSSKNFKVFKEYKEYRICRY